MIPMPTQQKTVLLVDDDAVIRMIVREALGSVGMDVIEAADAERGLELAAEIAPDLLILDIMLPRMDGLEMLEALRNRGVDAPVLVFSATGSKNAQRAHSLGATGYISKPFDLRELIDAVNSLLAQRDVA
jgi:DNA-binding response OmpR family regulator